MTTDDPVSAADAAAHPSPHLSHVLVELRGCRAPLADPARIVALLDLTVAEVGLTVLGRAHHTFEPAGYTEVRLLSESHLAVHTWPELGFVAMDLCSCRPIEADFVQHWTRELRSDSVTVTRLDRARPT